MAASEYLSTKSEADPEVQQRAVKSAFYTGIAYIFTVVALIIPYFLIANYIASLIVTIVVAITIIFVFNFYISVANDSGCLCTTGHSSTPFYFSISIVGNSILSLFATFGAYLSLILITPDLI